jgi:hypothetical protein
MSHKWDGKVVRNEPHNVRCLKCGVTVERVEVDGKLKNFHTPLGGERTKGLAPKCEPAGEQTEDGLNANEPTAEVPSVPVVPFQSASPEVGTNETGYGALCRDCDDVLTEENCSVEDSDQCDACDQKETRAALA